jgi:site-specific recombinase XerC
MAKANGIYERKGKSGDITYYVRYSYIYRDTEGNEKIKDVREKLGRKSRGFTREMAKEAPKARLGEIAQGRFNLDKVRKPHAFGELVESYLKHAESYKASFNREKYAIQRLQEYFGSATHLSKITTWTVEKWKRKRAKQVQPSTVNRELTILKHMLKMAVRWELASVNPAAAVSPFSIQEGRIRFASEDELPRLIEACMNQTTSPWLHPLVILALAHKAKAVQQLGDALEQIAKGQTAQQGETAMNAQTSGNLERFRNILVVKSGRRTVRNWTEERTISRLPLIRIGAGGITLSLEVIDNSIHFQFKNCVLPPKLPLRRSFTTTCLNSSL